MGTTLLKFVSHIITLICLTVCVAILRYTYFCVPNLRHLLILGIIIAVIYVILAIFLTRRLRGPYKTIVYCLTLQIIPICMAIGTYHIVYKYQTCAYAGANDIELQFCDVQTKQIIAAKMHGITPISSREEAINKCEELQLEDRLVRLSSNNLYYVRDLTHSVPYLVPKAEALLADIAREFQTISGTNSRFEITSVLRTKEDISKLQQVNVNATSNSCHCYATTFDISYVSFKTDILHPKNNAELREALSQAVYNMRKNGRCYVKFEKKQKCYHITVR